MGVRPYAKSRRSSSSTLGYSKLLYIFSSKTTWHVEQAREASQAPSKAILFKWAISNIFYPILAETLVFKPSLLTKSNETISASYIDEKQYFLILYYDIV